MKIASNIQIWVSQMLLLLILHVLVFDKLNVSAYLKPFAKVLEEIKVSQETAEEDAEKGVFLWEKHRR